MKWHVINLRTVKHFLEHFIFLFAFLNQVRSMANLGFLQKYGWCPTIFVTSIDFGVVVVLDVAIQANN
jgi:hypothetical protein